MFEVAITPEIASWVVDCVLMEELVRLHKASYLGGRLPAYNGRKSVYTAGQLMFTSKDFHIKFLDHDCFGADGC